jgi:formylglycine-generating enzyme required for sulfatase activity
VVRIQIRNPSEPCCAWRGVAATEIQALVLRLKLAATVVDVLQNAIHRRLVERVIAQVDAHDVHQTRKRIFLITAEIVALQLPVVFVTREQAEAYCAYVGKRLPTEAEWEAAARGKAPAKVFPWGTETIPGCGIVPHDGGSQCAELIRMPRSTIYTGDANGDTTGSDSNQIHHMAGNVSEWVSTPFDQNAYCEPGATCQKSEPGCAVFCDNEVACKGRPAYDPTKVSSGGKPMTRGGSYARSSCDLRLFVRRPQEIAAKDVGFRCVR